MNCIHCNDDFCHAPTHVYFCSPECWEEARTTTTWRILPFGPEPVIAPVRLGVKPVKYRGKNKWRYRLTEVERNAIISRIERGFSHRHIGKVCGVSCATVSKIRREVFV